ncbi:MAG: hypothetical protein P8X73_04045 [Ignavibacteriaceae bacterium]
MAWLEIIEIRTAGSNRELLASQLRSLRNELKKNADLKDVKIYRRAMLETDYCIHLFHSSKKVVIGCSPICSQLTQSLKDFGLVNHTVWIEKSNGGYINETKM